MLESGTLLRCPGDSSWRHVGTGMNSSLVLTEDLVTEHPVSSHPRVVHSSEGRLNINIKLQPFVTMYVLGFREQVNT